VESIPHRAFIGAYWTAKKKELALILGNDVAANTPISVMIPSTSGLRRVEKKKTDGGATLEPSEQRAPQSEVQQNAVSAPSPKSQDSSIHDPFTIRDTADVVSREPSLPARDPVPALVSDYVSNDSITNNSIPQVYQEAPEQQSINKSVESPDSLIVPTKYGIDMDLAWSDSSGAFEVKDIVRGGAAWKNGRINIGNIITHIDGRDLAGESDAAVKKLLLGELATAVILTVRDHVDPLTGVRATRQVEVMRFDSKDLTADFYDEEQFCDIPDLEDESVEVVSQAEWARRQLAQGSKEVTKMVDLNDISKKVSDQSKAAKEQLQTRSSITKTSYNAHSVAEQARWAKEQLENRKDNTQKTFFDADAVAQQARNAIASLSNRPQKEAEKKFDSQSVADQAKWAKDQLENRPVNSKTTMVDATSVSEQAQWAKAKLFNPGQVQEEYAVTYQAEERKKTNTTEEDVQKAEDIHAKVLSSAAPSSMSDAEEKKHRAMQKRLEFLAQQSNAEKAASETPAEATAVSDPCTAVSVAQEELGDPKIVFAPSPVERESVEASPATEPMPPVALPPSEIFAEARRPAVCAEVQPVVHSDPPLSSEQEAVPFAHKRLSSLDAESMGLQAAGAGAVDENHSGLPPPPKNFETEMTFFDAAVQSLPPPV
jgi:hypothetical protein